MQYNLYYYLILDKGKEELEEKVKMKKKSAPNPPYFI